MPSSRRQIATTAAAFASVSEKRGSAATARSTNSCTGARRKVGFRRREREDSADHFPRDPERLPAGRQDGEPGRGRQEPVGERRARMQEVLTVVEDEEGRLRGQVVDERVQEEAALLLPDPDRRRHHPWDKRRICGPGEFHEPGPVRVLFEEVSRHLEGQPGLPRAAGPRERDQARSPED
jgi:hypothetical protein